MNSPAQHANVIGNDNIIVQASGSGVNVKVVSGRPYLRLDPIRAPHETRREGQYRSGAPQRLPRRRRAAHRPRQRNEGLGALALPVRTPCPCARSRRRRRPRQDPPRAGAGARNFSKDWLSPGSRPPTNWNASAPRAASGNGAGTSRPSSSSITPPAKPSRSGIGYANSSTPRWRTAQNSGSC